MEALDCWKILGLVNRYRQRASPFKLSETVVIRASTLEKQILAIREKDLWNLTWNVSCLQVEAQRRDMK